MRYLKPTGTPIKIGDKIYHILFTLEVIDELQDKTGMSINEIMFLLTKKKTKTTAAKCILKYIIGEEIEIDDIENYSIVLLNTYIEQLKYKDMPKPKEAEQEEETEYEFVDVEYWFNIGKTVLGYPTEEVWSMTLGQIRTHKRKHDIHNGLIKEDAEVNIDDVI